MIDWKNKTFVSWTLKENNILTWGCATLPGILKTRKRDWKKIKGHNQCHKKIRRETATSFVPTKLFISFRRKVQEKKIPPCPALHMNFLALLLKALGQLKYPKNKRNTISLEIPSIFS